MPVGSPLEMYTTVLAWHLFTQFWSLLSQTGLILIPFAALILNNLIEARSEASKTDVGIFALRRSEAQLYTCLVVMFLFAVPTVEMRVQSVNYIHSSCEFSADGTLERKSQSRGFQASLTTYDEAVGSPILAILEGEQARVPLAWWVISHFLRAIPEAAKQLLPCQPDLRLLATEVQHNSITGLALRDEMGMFQRDCWLPAMNLFLREKPPTNTFEDIEDINLDTSWAGSQFFRETDGYYNNFRATQPLRSFAYNARRDGVEMTPEQASGRGKPYCTEWWDSPSEGLRERLLADTGLDSNLNWRYLARRTFGSESSREARDSLLYAVLTMDTGLQTNHITNSFPRDDLFSLGNLKSLGAWTGTVIKAPEFYTSIHAIRQAAPMLQAILLLFIILMLPILHTVSGFNLKTTITLVFVVASVQFWSFIFALCHWLDTSLWEGAAANVDASLSVVLDNSQHLNRMIFDYVIGACYLMLPIALTSLMSVAGARVGGELASQVGGAGTTIGGQSAAGVQMATSRLTKRRL